MRRRWLIALTLVTGKAVAQQYVGDRLCQGCHPAESRAFRQTGMGRSMSVPSPDDALHEFRRAATVPGGAGLSYSASVRDGKAVQESVRGQKVIESHEVLYGIGSGEHGRSYVIARGGALFLSPISYYSTAAKWDLSPGYANGVFRDFTRPVTDSCMFCHAGLPPRPSQQLPIGCERCHGPGELHLRQKSRNTIVNPASLPAALRDDVCNQCHLGGDIRVLRPGKVEMDFRPGTSLDGVVAIFSVPASAKPGGLDAVGHAGQLRMSRCWKASQGQIGCVTCHDPHRERRGSGAAAFYRTRCLECHTTRACVATAAARRATSPPDNCIVCHMPRNPLNRIAHISHTDHRIPRREFQELEPSLAAGLELTYETSRAQPDLRTKALAYAEAAKGLPVFVDRARRLLEEAARTYPADPEVQGSFGMALIETRLPAARGVLESAVTLGSKSIEVRMALAGLLSEAGQAEGAIRLCREAIQLAPYDAEPYLLLARIYLRLGERPGAAALLDRVRSFDPGHPALSELEQQILGRR